MKRMLFAILAVILVYGCAGEKAVQQEKLRVIFETDMGNDVDEATYPAIIDCFSSLLSCPAGQH